VEQHIQRVLHGAGQSHLSRVDEKDLVDVIDRIQAVCDDHLRGGRRQLRQDFLQDLLGYGIDVRCGQ